MKYFYKRNNKIYINDFYRLSVRDKSSILVDLIKIDDIDVFINECCKIDANLELFVLLSDAVKISLCSDNIQIYLFNASPEILSKLILKFKLNGQFKDVAVLFSNISNEAKLQLEEYEYFKENKKTGIFEFKIGNKYYIEYTKIKNESNFLNEIISIGRKTGNTNFKIFYNKNNKIKLKLNCLTIENITSDAINYLLRSGFVWINKEDFRVVGILYNEIN